MRATTVPRKEQNKAFDEEIGQPDERLQKVITKGRNKRSSGCSRSRKKSFLQMRGTTVPRKEQNKASDEEIEQPDERLQKV